MSDKPREGIYLDAALAVIGEQVEERIDALSRRRRRRRQVGASALAVATLLSGGAAAVAISGALQQSPDVRSASAGVVWAESAQLRCVEGEDADALAFFTAEYRLPAGAVLDAPAVCGNARTMIATKSGVLADASPERLVVLAESVLRVALVEDEVTVSEASFGRVSAANMPLLRTCVSGEDMIVQFGSTQTSLGPCPEEGK